MEVEGDFQKVVLIDFGLARKLPKNLVEKEDKKSGNILIIDHWFYFDKH